MAGEPDDLVACNTIGVKLGIGTCNVIEVAGLARHISMSPCERKRCLIVDGLYVYFFEGFEVVAGFAGLDESALVNIHVAKPAGVTVYFGLVQAQLQVATATRGNLMRSFQGVVRLGVMIEGKVFTRRPPGSRRMAILARYIY